MARIVIAAIGSRGDVAPLTGFARRLQENGHDVVVAAMTEFANLITGCGLETRSFDMAVEGGDDLETASTRKVIMQAVGPKGMQKTGEGLLAALADVPADLLLLSPMAELAGHPLAEARDIPSVGVRLQPLSATGAYPPSLIGAWSAGSFVNRAAGKRAAGMVDRMYGRPIASFRESLGLPALSAKAMRRKRTESEWPILHGYSPTVLPRPDDWRPGLEVTGYWWPERPIGWEPPDDVVGFVRSGSAPVFLGFGSLMMPKAETARMSDLVGEALHKVGVRGIVQAGWANLDVADSNILTVGDIPHDWLFDQVAAVVHSCGAGTMAAGLRAGLPAVAIPEPGGDQPFWARHLSELGVSGGTLARRGLTSDKLAAAIDRALTEPSHRANAEQLAARIAEEDGAARVVEVVENLVRV